MEDNMKEFVAFSRKLLRVLIELRELLEEECGQQHEFEYLFHN